MAWVANIYDVRNLLEEAVRKLTVCGHTEAADILKSTFQYRISQWNLDDVELNKCYVLNYPIMEGPHAPVEK
jgi:hypothetical protein